MSSPSCICQPSVRMQPIEPVDDTVGFLARSVRSKHQYAIADATREFRRGQPAGLPEVAEDSRALFPGSHRVLFQQPCALAVKLDHDLKASEAIDYGRVF